MTIDRSGVATAVRNAGRLNGLSVKAPVTPSRRWGSTLQIVMPALVIGGSIVAGMAWNIAPLTLIGALAAIVVSLLSPAIGLGVIALMGPLQPPLIIPSPGFDAVLVGAAVLGCVYRLPIDRPRIRLTAPILLLFGFILYVGMQQTPDMIAGYPGEQGHLVAYQFGQLVTGFGAIIVAGYVLRGRDPYPYLGVVLLSAVFAACIAIVTFDNPGVGAPIAGLLARATIDQRAVGSFFNPNYFGVFEAMATVTAVGLFIGARSARLRIVLLVTAIILGVAMALSLSRGALIALPAGLGCLLIARSRARTAILIAVAFVVATLVFYPIFVDWRLSVTAGGPSGNAYAELADSNEGRLSTLLAGPQLFLASPLFGIGWSYYATMSAQAAGPGVALAAHNWYVNVLAEEGIVGIVLWALLLAFLVVALRRRPTSPRSTGLGVLVTFAVGSLFLEPPTSFQTCVLPILVIVAALVSDWNGIEASGASLVEDPARSIGGPSQP